MNDSESKSVLTQTCSHICGICTVLNFVFQFLYVTAELVEIVFNLNENLLAQTKYACIQFPDFAVQKSKLRMASFPDPTQNTGTLLGWACKCTWAEVEHTCWQGRRRRGGKDLPGTNISDVLFPLVRYQQKIRAVPQNMYFTSCCPQTL